MLSLRISRCLRRHPRTLFTILVAFCISFMLLLSKPSHSFRLTTLSRANQARRASDAKAILRPDIREGQEKDNDSDFYQWKTTSRFIYVQQKTEGASLEDLCKAFPRHVLDDIQPVLRMGHSEPLEKLEAQLASVSACMNDTLLIFSDLAEVVNGHQIIDIFQDLPESYSKHNPTWSEYVRQKELAAQGRLGANNEIDGWAMDKFKFLPMIERTWREQYGKSWYVFYETDTYVSWDNMFRFLNNFDPNLPLYFGSPSPGRDGTWFANGGPSFVLSRGAMKELLHRRTKHGLPVEPSVSQRYEKLLREDCCGDSVVGWALHNAGVDLSGFWPSFNPHHLVGLPFADRYWCQPLLTLHKTDPAKMKKFWLWEQRHRKKDRPLIYRDIFHYLFSSIKSIEPDWMNSDWDSFRAPDDTGAHESFEACGQACSKANDCFQYNYHLRECTFVNTIRRGYPKPPEGGDKVNPEDRRFMAGWDVTKIEQWVKDRPCEVIQWVKPSVERIF